MDASFFDELTRRLAFRSSRRTALAASLGGLALAEMARAGSAEGTPTSTADQTASPPAGEKPVFMFVQTAMLGRAEINPAAGTAVSGGTPTAGAAATYLLSMEGHSGQTIYFSDRPDRIVGAGPTELFLDTLGFTPINPPNAALVGEFKNGDGVVVLKLVDAAYDAESNTLTYGAELLEGYGGEGLAPVTRDQIEEKLPAEFEHAALFIDDCPDLDTCMKPVPLGYWPVGPIPGGPYGACWQGLLDGCEPCWYSIEYLEGLCNAGYTECKGRCTVSA